jgi:hypothetical protein
MVLAAVLQALFFINRFCQHGFTGIFLPVWHTYPYDVFWIAFERGVEIRRPRMVVLKTKQKNGCIEKNICAENENFSRQIYKSFNLILH